MCDQPPGPLQTSPRLIHLWSAEMSPKFSKITPKKRRADENIMLVRCRGFPCLDREYVTLSYVFFFFFFFSFSYLVSDFHFFL